MNPRSVTCPRCNAMKNEGCTNTLHGVEYPSFVFHEERVEKWRNPNKIGYRDA